MEQTTEASQAVDELMPPLPEKTRHNFNVYAHDDEAMRSYALAAIHRYAMKVAAMTTHPFPVIDLNAQPASTEAAQGGKLLELFKLAIGTIAVHDQAEAERIAKMYRSDAVIPASVAAQGEDSARLECSHANGHTASWDWVTCDDCGAIYTGFEEREWGIAKNMWFKDVSEAKFYKDNGRYPDRARATADTGSKP